VIRIPDLETAVRDGIRRAYQRFDFSRSEITGSVGDLVTTLPLVVALAALTDISLPHVLLVFGVFQIIWGVVYGIPLSVEPMKALTALAIAGSLSYSELAVAGVLLGIILIALGATGVLTAIERWIGRPVVRGVQLAVALLLLETSVSLALDGPLLAGVGVVITVCLFGLGYYKASAGAVFAVGGAIAVSTVGLPTVSVPGIPPTPPFGAGLTFSTLDGVVAQLAVTLGNAAIATSLLIADLFDQDVSADRLTRNMGLMNLTAIPLGGIPMCHGCDGVAAAHTFGARTGGANIIQGLGFIIVALFASVTFVTAFPLPILGILLGIVALELSRATHESNSPWLTVGVGVVGATVNVALGLIAGAFVYWWLR
jgi:hypothetical protein